MEGMPNGLELRAAPRSVSGVGSGRGSQLRLLRPLAYPAASPVNPLASPVRLQRIVGERGLQSIQQIAGDINRIHLRKALGMELGRLAK